MQAILLVPLAAVLFSLHEQKKYEASAQVLLSRQNLANALTGTIDPTVYLTPDWLTQTQADVARVPGVARRALAISGVHSRSIGQLLGEASVVPKQNTDVLAFNVIDADPAIATRLATGYAKAFTDYRSQLDTMAAARARRGVQTRISELEHRHDTRSALYTTLVERDQQLATLEAAQTSNAYVIQAAGSAAQVAPKPTRNGIVGLALGIVLGIGLAFLWDALDTRIRSSDEIAERLRLPLLARLPEPPRKLRQRNRLVMLQEPQGSQAEAFRMLRTNLDFARLSHDARTIMVTSAVQEEGKTTTIANLGIALARAGQRVALVDLDLRRPFLHQFFDLDGPGLTQVAIGYVSLDEAISKIALTEPNRLRVESNGNGHAAVGGLLEVLISGPIPPDPGEFVGTPQLERVLEELKERADVVLVDAPPALHVGDALALSSHVDAMIVVTRMNIVRRPMLGELHRLLDKTPCEKLGFVVTGGGAEGAYGYGYGYGYGYAPRPYTPREGVPRAEVLD